MREFDLLQHIYTTARNDGHARVLIGPGDDMALVQLSSRNLLAAVDQIIDGRHVRIATTPLELVGRKAITRSLSDIAAMAGIPVATLVAATLPPEFGHDRAAALFDAMRRTALEYNCPIIGGDIAFHAHASHPLVCSVTVLAEPRKDGRTITRGGATVGDVVCVTGLLGGSLQADGLGRHLTFEPRIELAQKIADELGHRLHAMIDISDGLGRDASHIAEMSGMQIRLNAADIPCNSGCDWRRAVGDGEDYELCFAAQPPVPEFIGQAKIFTVGEVVPRGASEPAVQVAIGDRLIDASEFGWQHQT